MRVLPVLFNTDMVRAILDGHKTVTRRVVKPQMDACPSCRHIHTDYIYDRNAENIYCASCGEPFHPEMKPPYQPGDILYVRESIWQNVGHTLDVDGETRVIWGRLFKYVASDENPESWEWVRRPSIHMPKEAARIWLKVTNVKVERLKDIDTLGCQCEGIDITRNGVFKRFSLLWNSAIKKADLDRYGWEANPWVWVIRFERCEKPEENEPAG